MGRSDQARVNRSSVIICTFLDKFVTSQLCFEKVECPYVGDSLKVLTLCPLALCVLGHLGLVCETLPKTIGAWMIFDNCSGHLGGMARFGHSSIAHGVFRVLQATAFEEDVLGDAHDCRGNSFRQLLEARRTG